MVEHKGCGRDTPNDRIPLFDGEKQQTTPVPALLRPNATLQAVDLFILTRNSPTRPNSGILPAHQGNFTADQRKCSGICLSARFLDSPRKWASMDSILSVLPRPTLFAQVVGLPSHPLLDWRGPVHPPFLIRFSMTRIGTIF